MLDKFLEGLISKIRLMVGRAVVSAMRYDGTIHRAQLQMLADEIQDDVEVMQDYGFTSAPRRGAEAAVVFLGGNRDHGIVIATHDRRYRLTLQEGEVALHDDLGQKVHLKRSGILLSSSSEVEIAAPTIKLTAATKVHVESTLLECTGDIKDKMNGGGRTMSAMRDSYKLHTHKENNVLNGPTSLPSPSEM